jgi:hypothetical protein
MLPIGECDALLRVQKTLYEAVVDRVGRQSAHVFANTENYYLSRLSLQIVVSMNAISCPWAA